MPERLRPSTPLRLAALLLALHASVGLAHDWTSPVAHARPVSQPAGSAGWSGLVWAGPRSGPPATPHASDCDRPPETIELDGPVPPRQAQLRRHRGDDRPALAFGERRSESAGMLSKSAGEPEASAAPSPRALADTAPAGENRAPRPVPATVTAGVVDDNADFGAYLDFRDRHAALPVRHRDVSERYLLTVHDGAGRPVPDAEVTVHADRGAPALWARTDAGGQVWLHPRVAGLTSSVLEVQVRKPSGDGTQVGSAILRRGQRDGLQVQLAGDWPSERARLDLVFLVDATGSMADEIHKLRQSMQAMADQIARLPSRPQTCFGLVAYRDRGDAFFVRAHDFTSDLGAFHQVLGQLHAGGGGDYAEALNEALHTAVHRLSWRGDGATRLVLLVADAPPHLDYGAPWYDDDMQGALARGIKLFTLGASGLDRSGEYVFRQMAQYSGGRFVFLTYADARRPSSGPGRETVHEVQNYSVETLDKLVVRLVREELARRPV